MKEDEKNKVDQLTEAASDGAVEQPQETISDSVDSTDDEYSVFQDGGNEEIRKRQKRAAEGSFFVQLKKKWAEAKAKRAEERAKLDIQIDRKKARKIALIGSGVFVVIVGVVLAFIFLTPEQYLRNDIVVGDEIISEDDILAYIAALQAFMDENPGLSFGDDLRAVAEADLIKNAALRFYSSSARCDIPLTNRDLFTHRNGRDIGSEELATQLLYEDLGAPRMDNFRRIRAENAAFLTTLEDCVIQSRDIFMVFVTWAGGFAHSHEEAGEDAMQAAFMEYRRILEELYLPKFEQGLSNAEIAAHVDIDYYMWRDIPTDDSVIDFVWTEDSTPFVAMGMTVTNTVGFNDEPDREFPNFFGEVISLNNKVMELTAIGQHTDVFVATNGAIGIARLSALNDGFHISWDAMVQSYIRESRNVLGVARDTLLSGVSLIVGMIADVSMYVNRWVNPEAEAFLGWGGTNFPCVPPRADGPQMRYRRLWNTPAAGCVNLYDPCTLAATWGGTKIVDFTLSFRDQDTNAYLTEGTITADITFHNCSGGSCAATRTYRPTCGHRVSTNTGVFSASQAFRYNCLSHRIDVTVQLPPGWIGTGLPQNPTVANIPIIRHWWDGVVGQNTLNFRLSAYSNVNVGGSAPGVVTVRRDAQPEFESHSTVNVNIPGGQRVSGHHESGWNDVNAVTYLIPATVTGPVTAQVGFHHDLRKLGEGTNQALRDWNVTTPNSNPVIEPPAGQRSGQHELPTGEGLRQVRISTTQQQPVSIPAVAQSGAGATVANANVQLVNIQAGEDVTICQRTDHRQGNPNFNPPTGAGDHDGGDWSKICVTITRDHIPPEPPEEWCEYVYICGIRTERCRTEWQEQGFRHGVPHTFDMVEEEWDGDFFGSYTRNDVLLTENFSLWNWGCTPVICWNTCCGNYGCWSCNPWICSCTPWTTPRPENTHQGVFMQQTGTTGGRSFARNSRTPNPGNRDNWWYMGDLPADALYARPGDRIDFCHGVLRGAQMVVHNQPGVPQVRANAAQNWMTVTAWAGKGPQDIHSVLNPFRLVPQRPVLGSAGAREERSAQQLVRHERYTVDVGQRYQQRFTTGAANANTVERRAQPNRFPGSTTQNCSPPCGQAGHDSTVYNHDLGTNLGSVGGTHQTDYAIIRVPFNYRIEIEKSTDHTQSGRQWVTPTGAITTAPGSAWTIDARFHVRQVTNEKLAAQGHTAPTYATHTKDTQWRLVKSITPPTGGDRGGFNAAVGAEDNRVNQTAPCDELLGLAGGGICDTAIHRDAMTGTSRLEDFNRVFNHPTNAAGSTEDVMATPKGFYVDDLPAGSMICYMFSVFPATGYDRQGTQYADLDNTHPGDSWVHSQPVCVIVGKRPSATVQGAGLYAGGTIVTNQTTKTPCFTRPDFTGVNGAGVNPCWDGRPEPGRSVFGSWSEYEIIAGSSFDGWMSSGAAFAYTPIPRATALGSRNTATAFRPSSRWAPGSATIGFNFDAGGGGQDFPDTAIDHPADSVDHGRLTLANEGGFGGFPLNLNTAQLIARLSQLDDFEEPFVAPGSGGVNRVIRRMNSTIGGMNLGNGIQLGQTILYLVTSDVTITGDIAIDNQFNNLVDMPQVIIMAPNIHIAPNVSRVDAWLITAQQTGGQWVLNPSGTIHTCSGHNVVTDVDAMNRCANGQIPLVINGPVIVGGSGTSLRMLRTAGAGVGIESADPAEVFNLRADTYLWIFQRIQANRSVRTTFTHEMPPRL